ncbi:hypothetical protein CR513_03888, partial [Mucuna pruriens]
MGLLNSENQSSHTHLTLSLSFHSLSGARCFNKASRQSRRCKSRVWEARVESVELVRSLSRLYPRPSLFDSSPSSVSLSETESESSQSDTELAFYVPSELAIPDVVYQPWCIQYLQLEPAQSYELKSSLIHLLRKFHGLAGEDPHKYLKEFHVVCSTMRLQGIPEDYIKMKAFPFSLDGATKDWLYLQLVLFNKLCATCPHHQISLTMMDRSMIDAASRGALMDKTPTTVRHLISNMASNT